MYYSEIVKKVTSSISKKLGFNFGIVRNKFHESGTRPKIRICIFAMICEMIHKGVGLDAVGHRLCR